MADVIKAPEAPGLLPANLQERWKQTWIKAFKQALVDHPGDEPTQRAVAARDANRVLSPDEPTTYEEALALQDWEVLFRGEKNGKFCVVLINSKKFYFDIPVKAATTAESTDAKKNGAGSK
jgi:hypothetical protein